MKLERYLIYFFLFLIVVSYCANVGDKVKDNKRDGYYMFFHEKTGCLAIIECINKVTNLFVIIMIQIQMLRSKLWIFILKANVQNQEIIN